MSTRSNIAYKRNDGKYVASYCHNDGYIEGVGLTLYKHYDTFDKVKHLVDKGQMSSLGRYCIKPKGHSFDNRIDGYTVYYGRDRGEKDVGSMVVDDISELDHNYNYIFIDGKWFFTVYDNNKLMKLEEQFNVKKRVRNPTLRGFLKGKHSKKTIFDFVRQKINEQGRPSMLSDGGACLYRGPDGIKCAAGHLISDKDMAKTNSEDFLNMNYTNLYALAPFIGIRTEYILDDKFAFAVELQGAHDNAVWDNRKLDDDGHFLPQDNVTFLKNFNERMDIIANKHNL